MAQDIGQAYIQIIPSADGITDGIANAMKPGAAAAGTQAGTAVSQSMGQRISAVGKNFIKAGAIATAVSVPIVNGIKDALSAYEVQATAETKLTEIYKTRMGASKEVANETMKLASTLQKTGIIGDEVAISGAQQLATFAKYPSTVNTLLPAMENLLAQQKGVNATEQDAVQIGNLMGKVMMGQTGALKRVGISFTDAQEQVLKYGTEEEKAAMLAEVINQNVGNMNEELAKTPSGQMKQLSNSLGDVKEEVGKALAPVVAKLAQYVLDKVVPMIEKIVAFVQKHPIIAKIVIAIAGLLAVGGPLLIMLGTLMTVLPVLGTAFGALAGPIGIAIGIFAALVAAGVLLYKNWDKVKAAATALKDFVVSKFTALKDSVSGIFNRIKEAITEPIRKAKETIKGLIDKIKSFFKFKVSLPHIKLPHFSISPKGWKIGDLLKGSIPHLGIEWYASGGIMNGPTIFGGGERGAEAIVPLDPFWNRLDDMAERDEIDYERLGRAVADALAESPQKNYIYIDGKAVTERVNRGLHQQGQLDWRHA